MTTKEESFELIDKSLAVLKMRIQGAITAGMNMVEVMTIRLDMTNIATFIEIHLKNIKEIET